MKLGLLKTGLESSAMEFAFLEIGLGVFGYRVRSSRNRLSRDWLWSSVSKDLEEFGYGAQPWEVGYGGPPSRRSVSKSSNMELDFFEIDFENSMCEEIFSCKYSIHI